MHTRSIFLFISWGLALATLLADTVVTLRNVSTLVEDERWVAHTHEVKEQLSGLLASIVDIETSVRGYVISQDVKYLEPAKSAKSTYADRMTKLNDLVRDNPRQGANLAKLQRMNEEHQALVDRKVAAVQEGATEEAIAIVRTGQGKAMMDRIRASVKDLVDQEDVLLRERLQNANDKYSTTASAAVLGAGLSLAMTIAAFVIVWQELQRRRIAEIAVKVQAETARLNAERFRLLTESVPTLIWTSSADGNPTFFNRSWRNYTGMDGATEPSAGPESGAWTAPFHPEDAPRLRAAWAERDADAPGQQELRVLRRSDGQYRWHQCAMAPVRARDGTFGGWIGSLTDIQDQKDQAEILEHGIQIRTKELRTANLTLQEEIGERIRAEERAQTAAVELRRSNQELEKFAYVASHDLQEPLRKIQAFGDRLLKKNRAALDEQGRDYLDRMLASATRMRTLINDLLAFSRVATQNRPFVAVPLNEIIAGVLEDLDDRLTQSGGKVDVGELPSVQGDGIQFRQLFQNLIGNALKFAKPNQPPHLSIAAMPLADVAETADPPPLPGRTGWRLTFQDNGIGFDQQHENRIFELFQRLHGRHEYEGTGIGLAICRKIAERHGGAIHARGQAGEGARFIVDLPDSPPETHLSGSSVPVVEVDRMTTASSLGSDS